MCGLGWAPWLFCYVMAVISEFVNNAFTTVPLLQGRWNVILVTLLQTFIVLLGGFVEMLSLPAMGKKD